jgi:hypothetical protein
MARRLSDRTPELVTLTLIAVLAAGALLLGGGGGGASASDADSATRVTPAHVARIERRVEALRGLRFRHSVPVSVVSPAQARRDGLGEQRREQPPAARRTDEELLKLLGLLPPDADLGRIAGAVYGEQVAGYYDPRRKRLALVRGAGVDDVTLAHELTHALEDQHVDLRRLEGGPAHPDDDRATAEQALVEGTATLVMERYAARWPSATPLGDALGGLAQVTSGTPLPPAVLRALLFPYFAGERFVEALRRTDGGGWALVNLAETQRPPATTAEILHPARWLRAQQSVAMAVGPSAPPRAGGWRRVAGSTLGEEDLATLLAPTSGLLRARRLTAGWEGGRYALWRRGTLDDRACAAPCRARDAALLAVRMRSTREARALADGLAAWLEGGLHARRHGATGLWRLPGGSFATLARRAGPAGEPTVRVALAPSAALTARLAG